MRGLFLLASLALMGFGAAAQNLDTSPATSTQRFSGVRDLVHPQFMTLALGPAISSGLESDNALMNVNAAVNYNMADQISGKLFGDANFGTDSDSAQFLNFGLGADFYPAIERIFRSTPYLTGDAGFGMTRNEDASYQNGMALGLGAGMRFAAQALNWEAGVHYSVLTVQNDNDTPTVLALRAGVNF